MFKWLFCISFIFSFAYGKTLIVTLSDMHSAYQNVESFLVNVNREILEFKKANPTGKVVYIFNGDVAGISQWTDYDYGSTSYEIIERIVKGSHYAVVLGNHEGHDWNTDILRNQIKDFVLKMRTENPNFGILGANLTFASNQEGQELEKYFKAYQDFETDTHEKVRIIGMVLEGLFGETNPNITVHISQIENMFETSKKQILEARKVGIKKVIFSCHEGFQILKKLLGLLEDWQKTDQILDIEISLVLASHDHKMIAEDRIIDSGSRYSHSVILMDDEFKVESLKQVPIKKSSENISDLSPNFSEALKLANDEMAKYKNVYIGESPGLNQSRQDLYKGRNALGRALADSLEDWAYDNLQKAGKVYPRDRIISFYNSGGYRSDESFPEGSLHSMDLKQLFPYVERKDGIFLLKGYQIQEMYEELRLSKDFYLPQISTRLQEGSGLILLLHGKPLEKNEIYVLAMDDWITINGYKLKSFDKHLEEAKRSGREIITQDNTLSVMTQYLLPNLLKQISCTSLFQ